MSCKMNEARNHLEAAKKNKFGPKREAAIAL
jgi:hypothetical protein